MRSEATAELGASSADPASPYSDHDKACVVMLYAKARFLCDARRVVIFFHLAATHCHVHLMPSHSKKWSCATFVVCGSNAWPSACMPSGSNR